jgi:hypothetical protein
VRGKAGRRRANADDAALLLMLFARTFVVGGWKAEPALDVAPLTESEATRGGTRTPRPPRVARAGRPLTYEGRSCSRTTMRLARP